MFRVSRVFSICLVLPPFPPQFTKTRSTYLPMATMSHRLLTYLPMHMLLMSPSIPSALLSSTAELAKPKCGSRGAYSTCRLPQHLPVSSAYQVLPIFYFQCLQSGHSSLLSPNQPIVYPAWITARVFPLVFPPLVLLTDNLSSWMSE